jgi:hypothetical protein
VLISRGAVQQGCQHPHYGGMDHTGSHRNHFAGPHQKSLLLRISYKQETCMSHRIHSVDTSLRSSPNSTDSSVIAFFKRFINNYRQPIYNRQTVSLTTQDLDQALTCCVKTAQQTCYAQEVTDLQTSQEVSTTNSFKTLHPFIDQGLIRVGGRLQQTALPFQAMHPVILHPNNHFTTLCKQNTFGCIMRDLSS